MHSLKYLRRTLNLQKYYLGEHKFQIIIKHIGSCTKTVEALTGNDSQLIKCSTSRRRNQFKSGSIRPFHSCAVFQASDHTLSPSAGEIDPFEDYDSDNIDRPGGKNFKNTNHRNDQKQESVRISRPIQNVRSENENIDQFDEYRYPQNSKYQQTDDFQEFPKKSRFREQYQNYDDDFQYRTSRRSNYTRFPDREHQHGGYRRRSFKERDPEEFIPKTDFGEEELFDESNTGINFDKYDDIPVEVSGSNCPNHINSFDELMVEDRLKRNMARSKYGKPTPVQKYAFPIALAQRDLMSCAQTGSGKTAAFLIPLLNHILNERQNEEKVNPSLSPSGLIIAPTRELCSQLYKEAVRFAYRTGIRACAVYGGASIGVQMRNIEKGCDLLVATPGRLNDLLDRGAVQLERCKYLVLDEADRMLDMGFEPQIRKVVEDYDMPKPGERQTLMFSATFPEEIQEMARDFLNDYLFLAVGRVGSTSENITQNLLYVDQGEKVSRLIDLLEAEEPTARKLVFVSMKRTADYIEARLRGRNLLASSIHGDKSQRKREDALFKFKSGITPTLVATSVAARGLDIPNVTHVINYDLPNDIDEYVHRIGRTGRVGNTGNATSFFTNEDAQLATDLKEILKETKHEVPMWLEELSTRRYRGKKGAFKNRNVPRFGGTDYRKRNQNFSKYGGGGDHRNQFGNLHRRRTDDFTDRSLYGIEEEDEINTMKS